MWELARGAPFQNMDETPLQVLKEPGRLATALSYMWVNVAHVEPQDGNGSGALKKLVLFHYHPSRGEEIPLSVLEGFQGYLQTDGYAAYNKAGSMPGVIHVGCSVHLRRNFFDAAKITKKAGSAEEALAYIAKIYVVENTLRAQLQKGSVSREQFVAQRAEAARPIWDAFHAWLENRSGQVAPKSKLGEAISYALKQWPKILRYLDAWFLSPDNNEALFSGFHYPQDFRLFLCGKEVASVAPRQSCG
jgi:transposase